MKLVVKYHITNPRIGKLVAWVAYYAPHPDLYPKESAAAKELMRAVAGKNPSKTARGQAYLGLAREAYTRFAVAEYQRASNVEKLAAEAEDAYERLIKKYGDCDWLIREARGTIGDFAKSELYELRHLRIGKVAPEMEAEDLEGRVFMLSDSRGKVTVLVFWATWCGPCMAMVPRERELVARLKDKPFALIGVNGDESREKAKEAATREKMNWRSFWSGPNDSEGSIRRAWNVRGWPQVYVLDGKGVIRFKGLRGDQLAEAVDFLLKEMEGK
jgi:thiol-disulfide isomerase/thioredoxin